VKIENDRRLEKGSDGKQEERKVEIENDRRLERGSDGKQE